MPKHRDLNPLDQMPASWTDEIQEFIGTDAVNFKLSLANSTTLRGVAGSGNAQAAISIGGLYRLRTTNHDVAHPGGAADIRDVYVVASANEYSNTPVIDTVNTDLNWYIVLTTNGGAAPTGNTPGGRPITQTRKIGEIDWNGTAITGIRQYVGHTDNTLPIQATSPQAAVPAGRFKGATSQSAPVISVEPSSSSTPNFTVMASGAVNAASYAVAGTALAASHLSNGTTGTGSVVLAAGPTFTGVPAAPTAAVDTNTTQLATTAYVVGQGYAKLANPTFTGAPLAPTAGVGTNTTQIATTAYVMADFVRLQANQTIAGTKTFSSNPIIDPGTGTNPATLNLTARNTGAAVAGNVSVGATTGLSLNSPAGFFYNAAAGQSHIFTVGGTTYGSLSNSLLNLGVEVTTSLGFKAQNSGASAAVGFRPGTSGNTGYVEWHNSGGTRLGYMGFDNNNVLVNVEGTAALNVAGSVVGGLTAEVHTLMVSTGGAKTFTTAPGTQRHVNIYQPTYAGTTAGKVITNAATFAIDGAPIAGANMTFTNAYALFVQGGTSFFGGLVTGTSGFTARSNSGVGIWNADNTNVAVWNNTGSTNNNLLSTTSTVTMAGSLTVGGTGIPRHVLDVAGGHLVIGNTLAMGWRNQANNGWSHYFQNGTGNDLQLIANNGGTTVMTCTMAGVVTWATNHSFQGNVGVQSANPQIFIYGTGSAQLDFQDSGAGTDVKRFRIMTDGGATRFQTVNDAYSASNDRITIDHTAEGYLRGHDGSYKVTWNSTGIGFYGATPIAKRTGYGSGGAIGSKAALSSSSTLDAVIAVLSCLVVDLRDYGLIGA